MLEAQKSSGGLCPGSQLRWHLALSFLAISRLPCGSQLSSLLKHPLEGEHPVGTHSGLIDFVILLVGGQRQDGPKKSNHSPPLPTSKTDGAQDQHSDMEESSHHHFAASPAERGKRAADFTAYLPRKHPSAK